jgi:hypothetical protein
MAVSASSKCRAWTNSFAGRSRIGCAGAEACSGVAVQAGRARISKASDDRGLILFPGRKITSMNWSMMAGLLVCFLFAPASKAESGTVVDEATGRALEGVVVVASFYGNVFNPVQPHSLCYHLDVAVTDSNGRFDIARWSGDLQPWINDRRRVLFLFRGGYLTSPAWKLNTSRVLMRRFDGSVEERFEKALGILDHGLILAPIPGSGCDGAREKLLPLVQAMHREASQLAVTIDQRTIASYFLFELEERTLGHEVAVKNSEARRRELEKMRKEWR